MIRALLWDHDGVLVDTEALYMQATRETLAEVGVVLTDALYRQLFLIEGRGAWHLARERGVDDARIGGMKRARSARYAELLARGSLLIDGALPLLEALSARFRMAIVTSSLREHFEVIHRDGLLPRYFEQILTRDQYVNSKPHPEPYLTAMARLGLTPEQCLVIEDSERGLRAARAAGLRCWVIPSGLTEGSRFDEAERRFDSLQSLGAALLSLPPPACGRGSRGGTL